MAELLAFTAEHVSRLTSLSQRQLRYWDRTGFFSPALIDEYRRRTFGRIYSFRDLVGLRTIAILRKAHRVPLQELRRVGQWLQERHETPWSSLRFALRGRHVIFFDPVTDQPTEPIGAGQAVLPIALEPIANEMRSESNRLRQRTADQLGQIVRNRYVVRNAWVLAGTRIPTEAVWNLRAAGFTTEQVLKEYPSLTENDVLAALDFEAGRQILAS